MKTSLPLIMLMIFILDGFVPLSGLGTGEDKLEVSDASVAPIKENLSTLEDCRFKKIQLYGKVKFVESFPDIKIQFVESFPDIKVKMVSSFPNDCGKWQVVESFPDFTVQVVESFADLKVKIVESFPGME